MTGTLTAGPDLARTTARRMKKASKRLRAYAGLAYLRCRNLLVRSKATGSADVVVSMTSYAARLRTVDVALESIARGTVKPRRLLLWLDDPGLMAARPPAIRRLQQRGVEVLLSPNFGPHTKYYPYVATNGASSRPLVTADDDVIYPANWLRSLVEANREHPDTINAHWVSTISINAGSITQYEGWERRKDTDAGLHNFALGVSGVIYPPLMLRQLRSRGDLFMDVCPGADDIWLHWVALRAGIPTRQVDKVPRHFPLIPGSQAQALSDVNVGQNRNDHWIRALYSAADVMTLMASRSLRPGNDGEGHAG